MYIKTTDFIHTCIIKFKGNFKTQKCSFLTTFKENIENKKIILIFVQKH